MQIYNSVSCRPKKYEVQENRSAKNLREALNKTRTKQVVHLSGMVNAQTLSKTALGLFASLFIFQRLRRVGL